MLIAGLTLDNPFILAPLAGYTDLAFRLLCREHGAALVFSEMISSHGLVHQQKKTLEMIRTLPAERPIAFQLFGADPETMAEAAAILSQLPIDLIDINMGCPAKKVIKKGAGGALMKTPVLAEKIISKVCAKSLLPVTVKFRSGWDSQSLIATEFARMAEAAGAAALTLHSRTCSQAFAGSADRTIIEKVKRAVSIPVIGNGDIQCYDDGITMMNETGCDAVMIGRAALGNPWIFSPEGRPQNLLTRLAGLKRHLDLVNLHLQNEKLLARIKNHGGRYFKGIPGGSTIRKKIYNCQSISELTGLITGLSTYGNN